MPTRSTRMKNRQKPARRRPLSKRIARKVTVSKSRQVRPSRRRQSSVARATESRGMIERGVQAISGFLSGLSTGYSWDIRGMIHREKLLDALSEMRAVEQGVVQLYTTALENSSNSQIRRQLAIFLNQARRHADLYESTIRDLGGNPAEPSESAELARRRIESFQRFRGEGELRNVTDLENLLVAETQEVHNLETLNEMKPFLPDRRTKEVIERLYDELEDEEHDHVNWIRKALTRLKLSMLVQSAKERRGERRAA